MQSKSYRKKDFRFWKKILYFTQFSSPGLVNNLGIVSLYRFPCAALVAQTSEATEFREKSSSDISTQYL
eukprot:3518561-Amphidinium_carterae.1